MSTEIREAKLGSGAMFDRIAARYDAMNRVLSFGLDRGWRKKTVKALQLGEGSRVLDVATGTGDLAIEIIKQHPKAMVVGLDPSEGMIAIGAQKAEKRGLSDRIVFEVGDAQQLPHDNCSFDAATIAFGIRNVPDRGQGLRELARVVRPGGRIAVLELGEPRRGVFAGAARFHTRVVVPRLGALLSGAKEYRYLQRSIAAFPPAQEFANLMRASGLHVIDVVPLTFGVCTLYIATPKEDA